MKKVKYSIAGLLICGAVPLFAQDNSGAALFPELTPDVRGVGMGNTGVASDANAFSIWRNAAKSVLSGKRMEAAYSFTPWMRELKDNEDLHAVAGYYNLDEKQGLIAGFRFYKHAAVDLGSGGDSFAPKEMSIDLGYARKLVDGLSVGATLRYVRSDMSGVDKDAVANAVAVDLGVYYQRRLSGVLSNWAVGMQASNFGSKIDYGYGKYDQPAKVTAGGMVDFTFNEQHRLQGTLDIGCRVLPSSCWEGAMGVEYTAFKLVSVRGGYHYSEKSDLKQRYGTLGCGINLYHVRADFAYLLPETGSFLKNTWQLSLGIEF